MTTLSDLLNYNKLSLNYNPNANKNFIQQLQQFQPQPTQEIVEPTSSPSLYSNPIDNNILGLNYDNSYQNKNNLASLINPTNINNLSTLNDNYKPNMNPEIQAQYLEDISNKKQGKIGSFLKKVGLTPANMIQFAAGITALTGGNPYIASGLAQAGDKAVQQENEQQELLKNRRADYVKQMQGEQSKYDLANAKARQMMDLFPEGLPENMEIVGYSAEGHPMIRQKKINAPVYQVDNEGKISQVANVEANAKVFKKSQNLNEKLLEEQAKEDIKLKNLPIIEGIKAEQAMKPGTAGYANIALKLSDDFNNSVKNFSEIKRNFRTMESALEKSSTKDSQKIATDQALISTYNKLLDPSSVVRESEYARTPEGMGIIERAEGYLDKLKKGGAGLTQENRQEMVDMAKTLYLIANEQYSQQRVNYEEMAKEYGINPKLVTGNDLSYVPKSSYGNKQISNNKSSKQSQQQTNLRKKYNY